MASEAQILANHHDTRKCTCPRSPFNHLYLIMQNKPNLLNAKVNVSLFITNDYENMHLLGRRKNKPNTNPTCRGVAGEAGSKPTCSELVEPVSNVTLQK